MKTRIIISTLLASAAYSIAFDPSGKPGWKMDKDGKIELKDENPIYLDANGNEMTVEHGTIARLNGEAKSHRERAEKAEKDLKKFEGLDDPDAARKALETMSKLDQKKLIDAGEVDKVRNEISKQYETQIGERDKKLTELQSSLDNQTKQIAFKSSKFIAERVAVPAEMFEAQFGRNFKVENGKVVPYGPDGNQVYSKKRIGEIADLDEALEIIVEAYPYKDAILKAPNASGSGNNGGGGNRGGGRVIKRGDFEKMNPIDQNTTSQQAAKGELQIVD